MLTVSVPSVATKSTLIVWPETTWVVAELTESTEYGADEEREPTGATIDRLPGADVTGKSWGVTTIVLYLLA